MSLCVTAGFKGVDIDALACVIAYAELKNCDAWLIDNFDATIPNSIKNKHFNFYREKPKNADSFVITDVSNPNFLSPQIPQEQIIEIYDHHFGFESFWNNGSRHVQIESVGACATMIYELFEKSEKIPSPEIANLLYTAILSNTLNFHAVMTTERDKTAFNKLKRFINLPKNYEQLYYQETSAIVFQNPELAIEKDMHIYSDGTKIAQLELFEPKNILNKLEPIENGFIAVQAIGKNKTYVKTDDIKLKAKLEQIGFAFNFDIGVSVRIMQRKEIVKLLGIR
ncbi:MAG: DHH family phosphoesterase [Rickettsiales bacterium]|jgi:inorganic pyrophosphatase/exopolyphosphatase|nr:DHH family phosphoesterase [Rickettsiales bacterium]